MTFELRDAVPSDAAFIARNILAGMGYDVFTPEALEEKMDFEQREVLLKEAIEAFIPLCGASDTLYSYKRTRIASVDGISAGSLTAYPGDEYLTLRERTWGEWGRSLGLENVVSSEMGGSNEVSPVSEASSEITSELECFPGEFYLDTLAVLPEWRSQRFTIDGVTDKIGHLLMLDALRLGREAGQGKASLIVDSEKPGLAAYYSRVGFRPEEEMLFFGHPYTRMRCAL